MSDVPTNPSDPRVGRTFGDYEVVARVGGGSMGVVYKGRHVRLNSPRALKFLPPQWSHDEDAKLRFRREAEAASATDHPNICTIHDICETRDGQLFIVMAFCDGVTLKARLAEGALPVAEALDIATQMASALGKAHLQGVVHRDVKPGNVMLTEDGVRLVDFGLATFTDALQLTSAGTPIGTAAYMSPEQVRGLRADARSDVWAVGVVLYQMLTGRLPFGDARGLPSEHSIRHEAAEPIRIARPDVPEGVEQLVFRAMHKDPAVRYRNGRELAGALRAARGLADRTEVVPLPPWRAPSQPVSARSRFRLSARAAAVVAALAAAGLGTWTFAWPVARVPVTVAPFNNRTGDAELDRYRLALTQAATLALRNSYVVSADPYTRVLESLGRFLSGEADASSGEAIRALTARSAGAAVLIPTLLRDGGAWRVRLEQRDPVTGTTEWSYETAPVISSLSLDTTYQLALGLVRPIEEHFASPRMRVRRLAASVVSGAGEAPPAARSLEVAKAFEEGTQQYEESEYAAAHRSFALAAEKDARNPVLLAWLSRTAQVIRLDTEAAEAAERALAALAPDTPREDEAFVQAVAAESRLQTAVAEARYRERVDAQRGNLEALMDLAGFLDRQARTSEAVEVYHQILDRAPVLVRPRLELCRLYGPARLNEPVQARTHGQRALESYRVLGSRSGGAQSLLCLADTLRVGTEEEQVRAAGYIDEALRTFESLQFEYNTARADYYAALLAGMRGRLSESVLLSERALRRSEASGNVPLQPLILNNLGVAHVELGNRATAAAYYQRAHMLYQAWREEARAARVQANRGALLIEYGNPEEGHRDVRNALAVFQKLGDKDFEVFCRRVIATYYRNQGRHGEAVSELHEGLAIARERGLEDNITLMTLRLGLSEFDLGRYAQARDRFLEVLGAGGGRQTPEARIRLARTHLRLGDLASAAAELERADLQVRQAGQAAGSPLLWLVRGEWAAESGKPAEARAFLERGAVMWIDASPDAAAVEARGRLGLMDALDRPGGDGARTIAASAAAARQMGHLALEARCQIWLAQIAVARGRLDTASTHLDAIPADDWQQTIGPELRAEVHYWRSQVLTRRGEATRARSESAAAHEVLQRVVEALPEPARRSFRARPSVLALSR